MAHTPRIIHNCTRPRSYSERWDAYYCKECDVWVEARCGDAECEFCRDRPERPSEMEKKK